MDLDEVYYDAGACGRSYRRDAGEKKIIENEVTGYVNYREREERKSQFVALFRRRY